MTNKDSEKILTLEERYKEIMKNGESLKNTVLGKNNYGTVENFGVDIHDLAVKIERFIIEYFSSSTRDVLFKSKWLNDVNTIQLMITVRKTPGLR